MTEEATPYYSKDTLPDESDAHWQHWQKRPAIVRMMPLKGPCRIVTVDAPTDLPDGWEGWLAIDAAGHPYPLHRDVHTAMYVEPTGGRLNDDGPSDETLFP